MAKGKNKLNKTNSSGWLDNYSEELSISKYANGDRVIDPLLSPGQLAQLNKLKELSKKLPKNEEILLKQMQNKRAQDKLSVSKEKTTADKLKKLVREPVTTLADQAKYNNLDLLFGIPGRVGTGIYSTVGNLLTPSTYPILGKGAVNLVSNALTDKNVYEGVNEDASRILGEGLDILDIMDMGVALKSLPYLNKYIPNSKQLSGSSITSSVDDVGKGLTQASKKGYSLNTSEILKLSDEEVLSKTGTAKEDWELFLNHKANADGRYSKLLEEQFNSAYTPTAQNLQNIEQGKQNLLDFYNSAEYTRRLQNSGMNLDFTQAQNYQNNLINAVNKTEPRFVKSRNAGSIESDAMAYTKGQDAQGTNLGIDFSKRGLERPDAQYLASHEYGHTSLYDIKNKKLLESLPKLDLDPETLKLWESEAVKEGGQTYKDIITYYSSPDEARQRGLNAILYSKNKGISTDEFVDMPYNTVINLNRTGEIPTDLMELRQLYSQKDLKKYLKELYSITGAALLLNNGQEKEINQYADGGKVKDKKRTLSKLKKALSLRENLGNLDTKEGYNTPLNQLLRTAVGIEGKDYSNEPMEPLAREQDALRMYLGLPSKTGAFEQTAPNKYRIRDYNKLYPDTLLSDEAVRNWGVPNEDGVPDPVNPAFDLYPYDDFVMGKHYVTKGKDAKGEYLKYFDRFDFDPTRYANQFIDRNINPTMGKYLKKATPLLDELENLMFNPFELEDKIYYDPKTKLRSDIILQKNAPKVYPGQPMATPPEFAKGGKVNDNNGYLISNLDNFTPKKVINSNYITTNNMAFPVAANGVVLYPNTGDYIFPTDKVTEIPIMKDGGQHGGLDRWFAEKWVDVKTGKECGRQKGEKRKGYPACRPSKRINSDTPKTASELSSAEKEKFKREKTSSKRIDYSHKKEDGGLIYNDMKNKFKKYQGGGYLNYQDSYKGFGVGPQLSQDNSYFRSVMPTNIENMEEEINKPSVFSGINDVLGAVNQGVSQVTGLMSQFSQPTMRGNNVMPDISNWQTPLSGGKTDEQLNFENDQALKNAGLFNSFYPQKLPTTGSSMGPSMWKGVPFINKYGGYLRKYQNGGNMDMLPVGYPEYIHKSNVFHENYNPVPRVHFSDDTTPYDMGVNLNDLVNMYGGRVGKYQYGGMMPFYSRQRSPRVFNSNANRASAADLESAYENDFMHTKVRKDRQSFQDDKVDWGFMDWAKEPVGALTGVLSTVPIVGDITQSALGDSFLTRTGGYAVGKGVGNVGMGAAKVIGGAATGNVGMIGSGIGDVGEGVGSTIGTFQAKDALSNYDKSGYVSGNRLVRSSQDFGNMMDTASGLFGNIKGGVGMVKNMGGLKGMLGNMKGGATGAKGFGNIMSNITGIRLQDGGIVDYNFNDIEEYKYGGKVSQKINKKQNKTGWLDQL